MARKIDTDKTPSVATQIRNCLLALANWREVKPSSVNLRTWKCGTHACFGGHLASWPEFKRMGVQADPWENSPMMEGKNGSTVHAFSVAERLFGRGDLFFARCQCSLDGKNSAGVSDYDIVVRRLEGQIEFLTAKEAA